MTFLMSTGETGSPLDLNRWNHFKTLSYLKKSETECVAGKLWPVQKLTIISTVQWLCDHFPPKISGNSFFYENWSSM